MQLPNTNYYYYYYYRKLYTEYNKLQVQHKHQTQ